MRCRMPGKPLRAVFLNYLLDCLPAAVLELEGDAVQQLCVRTCVARNVKLAGPHRHDRSSMLQERAKSQDPKASRNCWKSMACSPPNMITGPWTSRRLPYGQFALEFARA